MKRKYSDLRDHLKILEERDLLYRITREINKDTELHPLVRWQYRGGFTEAQRKAFLFENVTDVKGKKYNIPVTVGAYAGSKYIYAIGLGCEPEEIVHKWDYALSHPIDPVVVSETDAPVHEEIHFGDELKMEDGGFDEFPVPISTPGFDCAPYFTCANWVTKDPETGVQNVGNYRAQIKARDRLGVNIGRKLAQDGEYNWQQCRKRGIPLEAALVIGPPPAVAAASVQKIPRGLDEVAVAGALVGEPIRVVKCRTVDLFVPAEAEIVIEGLFSTEFMEPEAPFGESHGHMNPRKLSYVFEATAVTHRKDCIFTSWMSQVTPSESSVIKRDAYTALFYHYLKNDCRIPSLTRVHMHEPLTNLRKVLILQMKDPPQEEVWRALYAASSKDRGVGKIVIAVDDDIDPENMDAVFWALAYRTNSPADVLIQPNRVKGHGPPFRINEPLIEAPTDFALLVNATLKVAFPPLALPKKEFMESARQIWEELGLPELKPQTPWFGYLLPISQWESENEEEAELALRGDHYVTGAKLATRRVKV